MPSAEQAMRATPSAGPIAFLVLTVLGQPLIAHGAKLEKAARSLRHRRNHRDGEADDNNTAEGQHEHGFTPKALVRLARGGSAQESETERV